MAALTIGEVVSADQRVKGPDRYPIVIPFADRLAIAVRPMF